MPTHLRDSSRRTLLLAGRSFRHMVKDRCFTHAAAIAFFGIVSIFPLLLFLIGILGFFLDESDTQREVLSLAGRYFPQGSLRIIHENIDSIVQTRGSVSLLSLAGLLWSATLMFDAINDAINAAWGGRQENRFLMSKLKSLLIVSLMVLVVLASTVLTAHAAILARLRLLMVELPLADWVWETGSRAMALLRWLLSLGVVIAAFVLTYRFLPKTRVTYGDVWLAGLLAGTLWEISKHIFVWYVAGIARYSQVYGSLSAALVVLLWTYVSSLIMIWGAEYAAQYSAWRREAAGEADAIEAS